jgi:hypothetical protein
MAQRQSTRSQNGRTADGRNKLSGAGRAKLMTMFTQPGGKFGKLRGAMNFKGLMSGKWKPNNK